LPAELKVASDVSDAQSGLEIRTELKGCFHGQIAVVTGASSGIGRAIALNLAAHGAEVCLVARRREQLESVAQEAASRGTRAHVCCTDLIRDQDIAELGTMLQNRFARVDILILCGGAIFHSPTNEATLEQFDLQYRSNVRGHYAVIQALLPLLRKQQGQIVFINSSVATRPASGGMGQFVATQYALRAIADSIRAEVNADGIRVLSVYVGRTASPRIAALFEKENRPYKPELLMQPEEVATMVTHALCLTRTAEVTDISMRPMCKSY
jgi:NADP-dependent 3-hydroxy acid dehydrogenase YdfG